MATTRSQAARDAAASITTERESSTSVASDVQTDNMIAFLQQIVSHHIEERRARENEKEEQEEREREKEKRDEERFEDLKKTVREYIRTDSASGNVTIKKLPEEDKSTYSNNTTVENSSVENGTSEKFTENCNESSVTVTTKRRYVYSENGHQVNEEDEECNDGERQQEGTEKREEEGSNMSHQKEGADELEHHTEETEQLREEQERGERESAVQEEESHKEAESQKKEELQKEAEQQKRGNRLKKLATESDAQPKEQMWGTLACDYVVRTLTTMEVKQHVEMRAPTTPPDALDVALHLDVICLSTQTQMQAQRQVLEEMMPQREGQATGITSGITVAVDACLKGCSATQHSRSTCGVAVDACLKGGGATQYSCSTCDVAVDACLKGGGGNPARRCTRNACRGRS